ncbi:hypothetical protein GCM10010425_22930 [Streptomyces spororaveus]
MWLASSARCYPSGFFENSGNLWRARVPLRLGPEQFLRHVSLTTDEPEGWRGGIRDGEVGLPHEDALEDEGEYEEGKGEAEGEYTERAAVPWGPVLRSRRFSHRRRAGRALDEGREVRSDRLWPGCALVAAAVRIAVPE